MQDFIAHLASLNYKIANITLDGSIHRVDREGKGNAWYIGWQNFSVRDGTPYVVARFGDWKTGEIHEFFSKKISKEDREASKTQIAQATKKAEEEKRIRQQEAATYAANLWKAAATINESEYLRRKKIPELFGARTILKDGQRIVLVPMVDVTGQIQGAQRIFSNGSKRFMYGQRTDGCFHVIGSDSLDLVEELYLCEGFATGASIYMATGTITVCAFNAKNLVSVAKVLKQKHPELRITVCGDDDRFTEVNGAPKNVGRECGDKAAVIANGIVIYPEFPESEEQRLTDFNDLHAIAGLDAVKEQLSAPIESTSGFIPLGYNESTYFFFVHSTKDIVKVSTFTEIQLFPLAPLEYWMDMYPSKAGIDWTKAKNALIQMSRSIGQFDSSRIRGTGVWLDSNRVVVNTGHNLIVDGRPQPMGSFKSWFIYVQTKNRIPPVHDTPLTKEEARAIIDACLALKWRSEKSGYFLAGWLAIARVAGALPIRPHVWLTGGSGTGKSTVMDKIVAPCLGGPKGKLYVQGGSTEAGLRQEVKSSSVPLIFDEFETTEGSRSRINAAVELLRQSWSQTQGAILKGSADGNAVQYQVAFAALVSSIRVTLNNDADRSRFAVLELSPHGSDLEQWRRIQTSIEAIDEDVGERLFARSCGMVSTILDNYRSFARVLASRMNQRFGQQYGMLLAGYWSLVSDDIVTHEIAESLIDELDLRDERDQLQDTDEKSCLNHLLTSKVVIRDDHGIIIDRTIEQIIESKHDGEAKRLRTYGVLIKEDAILVANSHAELRKIFSNTHWADQWIIPLMRIKDAAQEKVTNFGEKSSRCTRIPLASFR